MTSAISSISAAMIPPTPCASSPMRRARAGYPLRCIHIPKTIDNDLVGNDHTPGFPSAARFVAQAFMGVNLDNASLRGVYCAVLMGRHAGFLTAASAMARKFPDDGPHLIYLPERVFVIDKFLADVKATFERYGRCIIAASEGIHDEGGAPIITKLASTVEKDAHGNVQLVRHRRARRSPLRGDQEQARHQARARRYVRLSPALVRRLRLGCRPARGARSRREGGAIRACSGRRDGSVAIQRTGSYAVDYPLIPLESVAGKTRVMEDAFITEAGNGVTAAFGDYLRPLLGSGMPEVARLRMSKIAKILK